MSFEHFGSRELHLLYQILRERNITMLEVAQAPDIIKEIDNKVASTSDAEMFQMLRQESYERNISPVFAYSNIQRYLGRKPKAKEQKEWGHQCILGKNPSEKEFMEYLAWINYFAKDFRSEEKKWFKSSNIDIEFGSLGDAIAILNSFEKYHKRKRLANPLTLKIPKQFYKSKHL